MSTAPTCPYCGRTAELCDSAKLYDGRSYGPVWVCPAWPTCDAYVGCHKGTTIPKGRLSDPELRSLKKQAHKVFDPIWKARYFRKHREDPTYKRAMARGGRYKRLAELMEIPRGECHIGMFDNDRCRLAIEICKSGALEA